jgi:hypothetical protein
LTAIGSQPFAAGPKTTYFPKVIEPRRFVKVGQDTVALINPAALTTKKEVKNNFLKSLINWFKS